MRTPDRRNYRVNCDKFARCFPDFAPQWNVRRGAEELRAAFIATGIGVDDFEGPRFKRIAHVHELIAAGAGSIGGFVSAR